VRAGRGVERVSTHASWNGARPACLRRPAVSYQRPGVAPAGAVDREAPLAHEGAASREERLTLEGVEEAGEVVGDPGLDEAFDVGEQVVGDRFPAELPDHRAQLELGMEAEPVVDRVD